MLLNARAHAPASRYVFIASFCALVIAMSVLFQKPWTYNDGLGWDGAQYTKLTTQCGREPMRATEPFAYRIGVPCLAALLPFAPKNGLWTLNVIASVLLIVLMDAWLRRSVAPFVVPWLLGAFALHWLTPLRHVWWYPTYVDPAALCAIVGALLVSDRPLYFALICFAGTLIRETMAIVPTAFLAGSLWRSYRQDSDPGDRRFLADSPGARAGIVGLVACGAAIVLTRLLVSPTTDYWMLDSAFYWAYEKPLPRYVLAVFITFGPAIVLLALHPSPVKRYLREHPEYSVMLVFVAILAWIGGSDTERFLLWGAPIVLVLIGKAAEEVSWRRAIWPSALLLAGQAINGRWFVTTPDHVLNEIPRAWPLLTPLFAERSALLFSETPDRLMSAVALAEYMALAMVLFVWFKWRDRRTALDAALGPVEAP